MCCKRNNGSYSHYMKIEIKYFQKNAGTIAADMCIFVRQFLLYKKSAYKVLIELTGYVVHIVVAGDSGESEDKSVQTETKQLFKSIG